MGVGDVVETGGGGGPVGARGERSVTEGVSEAGKGGWLVGRDWRRDPLRDLSVLRHVQRDHSLASRAPWFALGRPQPDRSTPPTQREREKERERRRARGLAGLAPGSGVCLPFSSRSKQSFVGLTFLFSLNFDSPAKLKVSELRGKSKQELLNQLKDLKQELALSAPRWPAVPQTSSARSRWSGFHREGPHCDLPQPEGRAQEGVRGQAAHSTDLLPRRPG